MDNPKPKEKRTPAQNRAIHLYLTLVSDELNAAGLTLNMVLKPGIDIEWTPGLVKELLWRTVQQKVTGKRSTTELSKQEDIDAIYDTINRHLAERFPDLPHVPFPSIEQLIQDEESKTK